MVDIYHYLTPAGVDVFQDWFDALADLTAQAAIAARLDRVAAENFGDCKPVGGGVSELRIDVGPGYRVYFSRVGRTVVLLLCGGDKRKQSADIKRAVRYLEDYKKRSSS